MGERKHTPGPYHVSGTDDGPGKRFLHIGAASSVTVLASLNPHHPDALANAHMFAAAPEMLDALRGILSNPGGRCTAEQWQAGLRALSKAEGRS